MAPEPLGAGTVGRDALVGADLFAAELEKLRFVRVLERDVQAVEAMGRSAALWWAWKFQPACGRKSPRRIGTASPPTTVQTPSPSTTNRKACWVCRCSGASSPGIRYWIAAQSVGVAKGRPRSEGLARAIARRSPPRPTGTSCPACSVRATRFRHRQRCGVADDRGRPASGHRSRSRAGPATPPRTRGTAP